MEFNQHYKDYERVRKALKNLVSVIAHESVKETGNVVRKEVDKLVDSYCNSFQDVCIKDIWTKIVEYNDVSKPRYEITLNLLSNDCRIKDVKIMGASKASFATHIAIKLKEDNEAQGNKVSVSVYDRREKEAILFL